MNKTEILNSTKRFAKKLEELKKREINAVSFIENALKTLKTFNKMTETEIKEDFDIETAAKKLDENFVGMEELKVKLIDNFRKITQNEEVRPLLICGGPGIGKTSSSKSFAEFLGLKSKILAGSIVKNEYLDGSNDKNMMSVFSEMIAENESYTNIVIFDEFEKTFISDPTLVNVFLKIFDKEQNKNFKDIFLNVTLDLSKFMFILTANDLSAIPDFILSRCDVICLRQYSIKEYEKIAKKFQIPNVVKDKNVIFTENAIQKIAIYSEMKGVREQEKLIDELYLAFKDRAKNKKITGNDVANYCSEKYNIYDDYATESQLGKIRALSVSGFGLGNCDYFEYCITEDAQKEINLTGGFQNLASESVDVANNYVKIFVKKHKIDNSNLKNKQIIFNALKPYIKKDGSSAGIVFATAILSLITNKVIPKNVAMTGEITLLGDVMPVGGVCQKIESCQRFGVKKVYIPYKNLDDIKDVNFEGIEIIGVKNYEQIYQDLFRDNSISFSS